MGVNNSWDLARRQREEAAAAAKNAAATATATAAASRGVAGEKSSSGGGGHGGGASYQHNHHHHHHHHHHYDDTNVNTNNASTFQPYSGAASFITRYSLARSPSARPSIVRPPSERSEDDEDGDTLRREASHETSSDDRGDCAGSDTETPGHSRVSRQRSAASSGAGPGGSAASTTQPATHKKSRSEAWRKVKRMFRKSGQEDLQHHLHLAIHGRLHHSPLHEYPPKRCLDIGTGRGTWAIEFADKYQCCEVVGIDMQSYDDWGFMDHLASDGPDRAGPKVSFTTMKPGVPLRFAEKFDFIHVRYLSFAADHDAIFKNAYDNLNPGGWAEFHEWLLVVQSSNGFTKGRGVVLKEWSDLCVEGARRQGKDMKISLKFKSMLQALGFENLVQLKYDVPLNPWIPDPRQKRVAEMTLKTMQIAIRPFTKSTMGMGLGISSERQEEIMAQVAKDVSNTDVHGYMSV